MKPRVLIVEDNTQNMYMMTYLLEHAGFEVTQAYDGSAGIDAASATTPALILLDIQLPVMDGHAVARALRASPPLAGVPIVAVTSHAMVGDREKILAAGCTHYIEKPIDPDTFVAEVVRFLPVEPEPGEEG